MIVVKVTWCRKSDMLFVVRHQTTPHPNGCRWCGYEQRGHAQRYSRAVGNHIWVEPTNQQRLARMKKRRNDRVSAISGTLG